MQRNSNTFTILCVCVWGLIKKYQDCCYSKRAKRWFCKPSLGVAQGWKFGAPIEDCTLVLALSCPGAKVHRVKPLGTDWHWTITYAH